MCGIVLVKTPVFFDYHLKSCDRFLDRVCYSDRNVFLIFFERSAGNVLILLLLFLGGLHPAALILTGCTVLFRAYTFGGMLGILFSVYKMSGALVAFVLYMPVHLLLDVIFLASAALAFSRAICFRFTAHDFKELLSEYLCFSVLTVAVCLFEAFLLLVLFHPLGNLV